MRRASATLVLLAATRGCALYRVGLMFPPVGWQHTNMGQALYEDNGAFRDAVHECAALSQTQLPQPLLSVIYPRSADEEAASDALLQTATFTMPALFAVEYGLYRVFENGGCTPAAVVGHSIGEFVAAVAAGVLDLPTAMTLVLERGRAMDQTMPVSPGAMWALRASVATAEVAIERADMRDRVTVAAVNGPESTVVSGAHVELDAVFAALPQGTRRTRVRASHPDHSPLMEPVADALAVSAKELHRTTPPRPPRCLWASTTTGRIVTAADVAEPEFGLHWANHARAAVDFPGAMQSLLAAHAAAAGVDGPRLRLVEMGEGMLVRFCRDLAGMDGVEARSAVLPRDECALETVEGEDRLLCIDQCCDIEAAIQAIVDGQMATA
eukprot:2886886-Prymnesium_polylepis.1